MEYDTKADRRSLLGISMRVILALVLVGLLVAPIAVQAELIVLSPIDAWDFKQDRWEHSNVVIPWDGTWIPFIHQLNFNDTLFPAPTGDTPWAGVFYYGLAHEDLPDPDGDPTVPPEGYAGFQESKLWSLVNCSLYDTTNPYERGTVYTECLPAASGGTYCIVEPGEQDVPTSCTTGNCAYEIVTTVRVNLDLTTDPGGVPGADGSIDPLFPADPSQICFYAQARTPTPTKVAETGMWAQTLQARVFAEAGDRTVSFAFAPTAVELAAFDAAAQDNGVMLTWETATELDNLGFNIYRADSQAGEMNKINAALIPSKDPGSTVGAAYSFLDESAVPGATYYYWLEDVDVVGASEMNGPVEAKMGATRALPGRPRPAPMPGSAF